MEMVNTKLKTIVFTVQVFGCEDFDLMGNILLDKTQTQAVIFCESTRQKKTLTCSENEWNELPSACKG